MRIGFIGAGKHAQCIHIPNYLNRGDCVVAALIDVDKDLANRVAAKHGIPEVYASHAELIALKRVDAVVMVLNAIPFAETVLCDLLDAGIPVLTEKPLAGSVPSARRIVARWEKTGTPLWVGYHKRCDPASLWARSQIAGFSRTGELGPMKYARVHVSLAGDWIAGGYRGALQGSALAPSAPRAESEYEGMSAKAVESFRPFTGAHSHQLDLMRYLLGSPYRVRYVDPTGVLLAVESDTGVPGVFEFSPYDSAIEWREEGLVCFEKGYIEVALPAPLSFNRAGTAACFRDKGGDGVPLTTRPVFPSQSAMRGVSDAFLAALRGEKCPLCTPTEALESLVIAQEWARCLHP